MNIFGIKILTPAALTEMVEDIAEEVKANMKPEEVEPDDPSILESAKFAKVYNKGTASEMLETIKRNAKDADRNSMIALYLSIPHQMTFLLSMVPLVFSGFINILSSLTLLGMAVGLPYLCDRAILICIRNISTRVISTWDKVKAFLMLIPLISISVFLNVMAPGAELMKWVCGAVVVMVPIYQIIRSVRPNFKKAGADETKIRSEIADLAASNTISDAQREANRLRGIKAAQTRKERAAARVVTTVVSAETKEANRQRGLKAAKTRKANAERAKEEAAAAALAAAKPSRSRAKRTAPPAAGATFKIEDPAKSDALV